MGCVGWNLGDDVPKHGSRLSSVPGPAPWHFLLLVLQVGEGTVMLMIPWQGNGLGSRDRKGLLCCSTESFPFSGDAWSQSLHCCVLFQHLELFVWPWNSTGKVCVSKCPHQHPQSVSAWASGPVQFREILSSSCSFSVEFVLSGK